MFFRPRKKTDKSQSRGFGCLFFLMVCGVCCGLLVINSAIVWSAYPSLQEIGPQIMSDEKFRQGTMVIVPILLICLQMFLYDLLIDCLPLDKQ